MKKTNKYLIILSWIIVAIVIIIIFSFSTQSSESSNSTSDGFIQDTIGGIGNGAVIDKIEEKFTLEKFMVFVRKLGHFFEYALLGFVMFNALHLTFDRTKLKNWGYAIIFSSIVANFDEIYQGFFDRGSSGVDVCIDTLGAILGAAIMLLIYCLIEKRKKKSELKNG